jgi:ABC-2 type transport system permease protein
MQQLKTLIAREWMQQHRAWLRLSGYFVVVAWGIFYLAALNTDLLQDALRNGRSPLQIAAIGIQFQTILINSMCFIFLIITIPSLPYRDIDDKSLAFWRSLPVSDYTAMGTTLLMNAIVLPLLAMSFAQSMGLLLSLPLWGMAALDNPSVFAIALQFLLAMPINATLALLLLLPVLLLFTLGNYLIRRWGLLLTLFSLLAIDYIYEYFFKSSLIANYLKHSTVQANQLLIPFSRLESAVFSDLKLPFIDLQPYVSNSYAFFTLAISSLCFLILVYIRKYK